MWVLITLTYTLRAFERRCELGYCSEVKQPDPDLLKDN